jgi:hypothetical protein
MPIMFNMIAVQEAITHGWNNGSQSLLPVDQR